VPAFYADEDFPGPVAAELRRLGYDVLTVQQDGRAGGVDADVLARGTALGRVVATKNRRHFYRLHAKSAAHAGIVVIWDDPDRAALAERIAAAVAAVPDCTGLLLRVSRPAPPPPAAPAAAEPGD
jgi:hypothetical protein